MELLKQHLEFQGKQIDELKQENRETRQFMRAIFLDTAAEEEPIYMSQPEPELVCAVEETTASENSALVPVPTKLIEELPEELPIQVQAPLTSPKDLDSLLPQKGL